MRVALTLEVAGKKFRVQEISFDCDCSMTNISYREFDDNHKQPHWATMPLKTLSLPKVASVQECMSEIAEQERLRNENK